jgi:hypothetical protein
MISRRGFACAVVAGCAVLALGGCDAVVNPGVTTRYRLKVYVETPDGVKSGSSVLEVHASRNDEWSRKMTSRTGGYSSKGEAVAVDLPDGRTLFALLRGEAEHISPFDWLWMANGLDLEDFEDPQSLLEAVSRGGEERSLPRLFETGCVPSQNCNDSAYPMLVTFKDIADPTSVEQVDPDDLAGSFGQGYRLKSITVQVTDAPVTVGIGDRLHAIGVLRNNSLDKDFKPTTNPTLAQKLGYGDFVRK